ncbi:sugar ABC transporter permease [Clostridium estertheticum]|uniref:Sugar ABC transporter permease n=1 Tax=Clostridium estertheticum TaxID=238834 RepID=A0AA47EN18_9CLOT|nr:sugar ABC transporter permease [Clostridium estertheticum]WAG62359.1 sugar ABC transporter permease [Clostridium estertheticum]WAG63534.1 sugar ABC transporter permease [Clostridium estertheticum]
MKENTKRKIIPWMFLAPFLIIFLTFMVYPIIYSLAISFTKYRGGEFVPVGLSNFKFVLTDPTFLKAIKNTFTILIIQVPIQTMLALVIANFLNSSHLKFKGFFRMFVFMPVLIDTVSYSIVFLLFFSNSKDGLINSLISMLGGSSLEWMNVAWLSKIVIITALTWRWTGYNAIIILSGLQNIAADLYEAAAIDGATKIKQFFSITLPGVKPVLLFSVVLSVNGVLQLFTETNLITKGGPVDGTLTIVQYLYNTGFVSFNYGVSSAGAYILAVMIAILTFIQMKVTKGD